MTEYRITSAQALVRPLSETLTGVRWAHSRRTQRFILAAFDLIAITAGFAVALAWGMPRGLVHYSTEMVAVTLGMAVGWLAVLFISGAYSLRHLRAGSVEYKRAINSTAWAAGIFGVACFLLNHPYPRSMFVIWVVAGVVGLCLSRYTRRQLMHRLHAHELYQTPVIVAGADHHVDEVAKVLNREKWIGYKVVGAVTRERIQTTATGLTVLGTLDDMGDVLSSHNVHVVFFAEGSFDCPGDFRRLAWRLEESQVQMVVAPTLADVSAERLEFRPVAGLPLVDVGRPRAIHSLRWIKRAADIVGAGLLLLLAAPVMLATAIAIKREDGGPIIFRQKRIGLKGEEFHCLKFRSMCTDAEARLAALRDRNEGAGVLFKMEDDPRITKVGKFIRRFSIDELPQLWNAFRGDMSLVGPRPALPSEVAQYEPDTRRRLQVRPGLTGLWQVSGRSKLSWEDTVRLDLYYVDNWSMVQDLMILFKTFRAVVGSAGAY